MTRAFTLAALPLLLLGANLIPETGYAAVGGPLDVALEPSPTIAPKDVAYRWHADNLEVSGKVAKTQIRHGRIGGHVDIELLDAQGNLLQRHSTALRAHLPNPRDPRRASFHTTIENVPESVAEIRVSHQLGHWY